MVRRRCTEQFMVIPSINHDTGGSLGRQHLRYRQSATEDNANSYTAVLYGADQAEVDATYGLQFGEVSLMYYVRWALTRSNSYQGRVSAVPMCPLRASRTTKRSRVADSGNGGTGNLKSVSC